MDLRCPTGLPAFTRDLRDLVGAELAVAYCPIRIADGFGLSFLHTSGFSAQQEHIFAQTLSISGTGWGIFDPTRPEPDQQNVAREFAPMSSPHDFERAATKYLGLRGARLRRYVDRRLLGGTSVHEKLGLAHHRTTRVLVCHGRALLGYVGIFDNGPLHDARRALQSLVPSLQLRLAFEAHFVDRRIDMDALGSIPAEIFVGRSANDIDAVNSLARSSLDRDSTRAKREITDALRGSPSRFMALELHDGADRRRLLIGRARPTSHVVRRASEAARRWKLTPREGQVLSLLAEGNPNKTIAAALSCTVRTIEFHVGGILRKAGVESRAEIVAALAGMD